jgi:predicted metalloprotease
MKWDQMRRSDNVEDVRGGSGFPGRAAGGVGVGGLLLALALSWILGVNPADVLVSLQGGQMAPTAEVQGTGINDRDADFVKAVLGDTEVTWNKIFAEQVNADYQEPRLVLFNGGVNSACGMAQAAMGPFYCPSDEKVYLDMSFFQQVQAAAGPNADFARAYAIAHEVGHHIQNELGIATKVRQLQQRSSQEAANNLSVRLELQADCFAGVWGHYTAQRGLITNQDVEAAMNTAAQIGDDFLQRQSRGYIVPESFTHGSSKQRVSWFKKGLQTGDINQCNTFGRGVI